jgi:hypothetical protein
MKSNQTPSKQTMEHDAANGMRCQHAHMLPAAATLDARTAHWSRKTAGMGRVPPFDQSTSLQHANDRTGTTPVRPDARPVGPKLDGTGRSSPGSALPVPP